MWQHCHTYKTHTSAHTSGAIAMCRQSVPYGVVSVQTSTLVHLISPTTSENFSVCWNTTDFLFLVLHQSPRSFCCLCTCCTLAVASSPGSFSLSAHERRELGDEDTLAGSWVLGMCIHFRMMVKLALVPDPNQCGNETGQLLASFHALRHSPVSVLLAFGENGGEGGGRRPGRFCELQRFSTTPSVYLTSLHMTKSPRPSPSIFLHTASNQNLEAGKAWELLGYVYLTAAVC